MDIHSLSARPEEILVLFGAANLPGGMPAEARGAVPEKSVARDHSNKEKQASPREKSAKIVKLDPMISASRNTALSFSVNKDLGEVVVQVIDKDTMEVIRQIPSEERMRLLARMEKSVGMLVDQEA